MKKDATASIRINSGVKAVMTGMKTSPQKIVDLWIEKNLTIKEEKRIRIKRRK